MQQIESNLKHHEANVDLKSAVSVEVKRSNNAIKRLKITEKNVILKVIFHVIYVKGIL